MRPFGNKRRILKFFTENSKLSGSNACSQSRNLCKDMHAFSVEISLSPVQSTGNQTKGQVKRRNCFVTISFDLRINEKSPNREGQALEVPSYRVRLIRNACIIAGESFERDRSDIANGFLCTLETHGYLG